MIRKEHHSSELRIVFSESHATLYKRLGFFLMKLARTVFAKVI
jgi:hypothetical protein